MLIRAIRQFIVLLTVSTMVAACSQQTTTEELLAAGYLPRDSRPVDLVLPENDQAVASSPVFSWSLRSGISSYILEISERSDFISLFLSRTIQGSTYTFNSSHTALGKSFEPVQYFWRVRVSGNNSSTSVVRSFFVMESGVIYVDLSSTNALERGNRSAPYKSVKTAIDAANAARLGNFDIPYQLRIAQGTYSGQIFLKGGISLFGGYKATDWSRDVASNTTVITSNTTATMQGYADITVARRSSTIIDGLTIQGSTIPDILQVINLVGASPIVRNCQIIGVGTGSSTCYGIQAVGSSAQFDGNTIFAGGSCSSTTAFEIANSVDFRITRNTIDMGRGAGSRWGISTSGTGPIIVLNNVISTASTTGVGSNAYGIALTSATDSIVSNNTIAMRSAAPEVYGIRANGADNTIAYTNNLIYITAASGTTRTCFAEVAANSNPASFQNNALIQCPTGLYLDNNVTQRLLESDLNDSSLTTGGVAGRAGGNVAPPTIADFTAALLVSATDLHLTAASPAALRTGGKNTSLAICGLINSSSCGGVTVDIDSKSRTAAYSIGAYEYD